MQACKPDVVGLAASIHPLPFQQTCPKMETLRLPYRGFWGQVLRSSFGALMPRMGIGRGRSLRAATTNSRRNHPHCRLHPGAAAVVVANHGTLEAALMTMALLCPPKRTTAQPLSSTKASLGFSESSIASAFLSHSQPLTLIIYLRL